MKIADHVEKWRRFDALRSRFHPTEEFELWYWASLSGGTALINAALHAARLTDENDLFATQMPHVYAVLDAPGIWHHELGERCDLIHAGLPEITDPLPADLAAAFAAMEVIETYRDPCIRFDRPVTPEVVAACEAAYAAIVSVIEGRLAEKLP